MARSVLVLYLLLRVCTVCKRDSGKHETQSLSTSEGAAWPGILDGKITPTLQELSIHLLRFKDKIWHTGVKPMEADKNMATLSSPEELFLPGGIENVWSLQTLSGFNAFRSDFAFSNVKELTNSANSINRASFVYSEESRREVRTWSDAFEFVVLIENIPKSLRHLLEGTSAKQITQWFQSEASWPEVRLAETKRIWARRAVDGTVDSTPKTVSVLSDESAVVAKHMDDFRTYVFNMEITGHQGLKKTLATCKQRLSSDARAEDTTHDFQTVMSDIETHFDSRIAQIQTDKVANKSPNELSVDIEKAKDCKTELIGKAQTMSTSLDQLGDLWKGTPSETPDWSQFQKFKTDMFTLKCLAIEDNDRTSNVLSFAKPIPTEFMKFESFLSSVEHAKEALLDRASDNVDSAEAAVINTKDPDTETSSIEVALSKFQKGVALFGQHKQLLDALDVEIKAKPEEEDGSTFENDDTEEWTFVKERLGVFEDATHSFLKSRLDCLSEHLVLLDFLSSQRSSLGKTFEKQMLGSARQTEVANILFRLDEKYRNQPMQRLQKLNQASIGKQAELEAALKILEAADSDRDKPLLDSKLFLERQQQGQFLLEIEKLKLPTKTDKYLKLIENQAPLDSWEITTDRNETYLIPKMGLFSYKQPEQHLSHILNFIIGWAAHVETNFVQMVEGFAFDLQFYMDSQNVLATQTKSLYFDVKGALWQTSFDQTIWNTMEGVLEHLLDGASESAQVSNLQTTINELEKRLTAIEKNTPLANVSSTIANLETRLSAFESTALETPTAQTPTNNAMQTADSMPPPDDGRTNNQLKHEEGGEDSGNASDSATNDDSSDDKAGSDGAWRRSNLCHGSPAAILVLAVWRSY